MAWRFDTSDHLDLTPLQRALASAPERSGTQKVRTEQELFCFRVGELRLAVASSEVREVIRLAPLTPLPRTPAYVMGVMGHRGEVLPVLDLLRLLGKGEARTGHRARLFVAVAGGYVAGVLTDEVFGLRRIPSEEILPAPLGGDAAAEHLVGLVRLDDGKGGTLSVLDMQNVLGAARQRAVSR